MTRTTLILRYGGFAVIAVLANLAMQRVVLWGTPMPEVGFAHYALALGAGTLVGLAVKYVLDKRWIFFDTTTGAAAQGKQFTLYTLMGIATTAIFWVTQTSFWLIWQTDLARETGAVLGLTVGYLTKYALDRRFVFNRVREVA